MNMEEKIRYALDNTEILRPPRQLLATFEATTIHYYLLTEPVYRDFVKSKDTVIREGNITWSQPRIITPYYLLRIEGFSKEARESFKMLARENPYVAGLLYKMTFKKESIRMEIVSHSLTEVFRSIETEIDKSNDPLCTIIKGVDELWDVSVSKFIHEMIIRSASFSHIPHLRKSGLIEIDGSGFPVVSCDQSGIPLAAMREIEHLFELVKKKELDPSLLKQELDKWGLFKIYEDRFLDLFRKRI